MSRRIYLALAATLSLAGCNLGYGQDTQAANPSSNSSAPDSDDVAALKKEVAVQAHTISQLQAQLAQAGITHQAVTTSEPIEVTDTSAAAPSTNAVPAGPLKALPLDATNAVVNAAAPGAPATDAGPSKSYTVVKGDSIWKIAHKMYPGDTKNGVDKIQEANKDAIGGKPLKIGQVLIIPQ